MAYFKLETATEDGHSVTANKSSKSHAMTEDKAVGNHHPPRLNDKQSRDDHTKNPSPLNAQLSPKPSTASLHPAHSMTVPQTPPQDTFNNFVDRFQTETRDSQWAASEEERIEELYSQGKLQKILLDVTCRSTFCRMEFDVDMPNNLSLLAQLPGLSSATTKIVNENNQKKLVTFVRREGSMKR